MAAYTHDLSFAQCESWVRDFGLSWDEFLKQAKVKSDQYVLKDRWNKGKAPRDRIKVRATLQRLELKQRTPTGILIAEIEQWNKVGRQLARRPHVLHEQLERVLPIGAATERLAESEEHAAENAAELAEILSHATAAPRGMRK